MAANSEDPHSYMGISDDIRSTVKKGNVLLALSPRGRTNESALENAYREAVRNRLRPVFVCPPEEVEPVYRLLNERFELSGRKNELLMVNASRFRCKWAETRMGTDGLVDFCTGGAAYEGCPYQRGFDMEEYRKAALSGGKLLMEEQNRYHDLGMCPAKMAMDMASDTRCLVADFSFIFSFEWKRILENIGIKGKDMMLTIVDPFSLLEHLWESATFTIRRDELHLEDWGLTALSRNERDMIQSFLDSLSDMMADLEPGKQIQRMELHERVKKNGESGEESNSLQRVLEVVDRIPQMEGGLTNPNTWIRVHGMRTFIKLWIGKFSALSRTVVVDDGGDPGISISLIDPQEIIGPFVESTASTLMFGDSLYPHNIYATMLGIKMDRVISRSYVGKELLDRSRIHCLTDVDTSLDNRNPEMFTRIANNITTITESTRGRVLSVFPSYRIMDRIIEQLDLSRIDREVLVESRGTPWEEREKLISGIADKDECLVLAVQKGAVDRAMERGLISASAAVMVGMHLPPPDPTSDHKKAYFRRKFETAGYGDLGYVLAIWLPAINRAMKMISGMMISPVAEGNGEKRVFLMDRRFWIKHIRQFFPQVYRIGHLETVGVLDPSRKGSSGVEG